MNERVVTFGPEGAVTGILTEPARDESAPTAPAVPAVLMWNVGMNHRVGPWRFNVELARFLARVGVPSLRFDVSGLGDSEATRDTRSDVERATSDVLSAIAFLERRGVARSFVLVGFCSSVDAAHRVAAEDPRVSGVVYLEGYAHRTRGFWLRYPLRVGDRTRLRRFLKASFPRLFGDELVGSGWGEQLNVFQREYPTLERLRTDFRRMVHDGKKLLFIYVGGDTDYNHRDQFSEMYRVGAHGGTLEVDYYARMDHTFFRVRDRERVIERVVNWVRG